MNKELLERLPHLLETLGLFEPPMGFFYTDEKPGESLGPPEGNLPTREKEIENRIDWQTVRKKIDLSRKKWGEERKVVK